MATVKEFIDTELAYLNATNLNAGFDAFIENAMTSVLPDTTTAGAVLWEWTPQRMALLSVTVIGALTCLILGTSVIAGIFLARKQLTGYDALILNHLFVNILMGTFVVPLQLASMYDFAAGWRQSSTEQCHVLGFIQGLIRNTKGVTLTVLSLHQVGCLLSHLVPNCCLAHCINRHRYRRWLIRAWLAGLVGIVWMASFAAETVTFELEAVYSETGSQSSCAFRATVEVMRKVILVEELITMWIPYSVALLLLTLTCFFIVFNRSTFNRITLPDKPPQSVVYSTQTSVDSERTDQSRLLAARDSCDSSTPSWDDQVTFHDHLVGSLSSPSETQNSRLKARQKENQEFSRDSVLAWLVMVVTELVTLGPSNIRYLVVSRGDVSVTDESHHQWLALVMILVFSKVVFIDFLVLFLVPRYRRSVILSKRRLCGF